MIGLLIDAGNTRLKWALVDTGDMRFLQSGHFPTAEVGLPARLARLQQDFSARPLVAMFVSVAADPVNAVLVERLQALCPDRWSRFEASGQVAGLVNAYACPQQLGADRLAAAIGAWERVRGDALVVNCGTATTIDLVVRGSGMVPENLQKKSSDAALGRCPAGAAWNDPAGEVTARFAGGVILPGLSLMKAALFRNTARLPDAAGQWVSVPDNTDDAIATGCLEAQVGAVLGMRERLPTAAPVVLSGGAAPALRPLLLARQVSLIEAPELVLEGLAVAILHRFPQ